MFAIKHRHRLAGKKHNPVAVSDGNPLAIRLAADHERRSKRRDQHRRNGALHAKGNKVHCNNRTGRTGNNADDITDDIVKDTGNAFSFPDQLQRLPGKLRRY